MKTSGFLTINWLDLGKGAIVAILVFLLNFAQETWIPSLNIDPAIKLLIITLIGYLIKNFFTKSKEEKEVQLNGGGAGTPNKPL